MCMEIAIYLFHICNTYRYRGRESAARAHKGFLARLVMASTSVRIVLPIGQISRLQEVNSALEFVASLDLLI